MTLDKELSALEAVDVDRGPVEEAQTAAHDPADLARYRDDPVAFAREVLGVTTLWDRQAELLRAVRDEPQVALKSGNAVGKDHTAAIVALWAVFARDALVIATSRTERQLIGQFFKEVRRLYQASPRLSGHATLMRRGLRVNDEDRILCFVSTDIGTALGYHHHTVVGIISEAGSIVDDDAFDAMHRCAVGADDRIFVYGNPDLVMVPFHDAFDPDSGWHRLTWRALDHPNVTTGRTVIPGAITVDALDRWRRTWGEGSRKWRTAVLAEFPFAAEDQLVDLAWRAKGPATFSARFNAAMAAGLVIAVDPSRYGSDGTAFAIRRGPIVFAVGMLPAGDLMRTTGAVVNLARDWTSELRAGSYSGLWVPTTSCKIVVDEVGLGSGVLDRLREQRWDAVGFAGSRAPIGEKGIADRYANLRAQTYWALRSRLERAELALPDDDLLWKELVETRWTTGSDGRIILEPKKHLRKRLKRSPDRADAATMTLFTDVDPDLAFTYGGALVPI